MRKLQWRILEVAGCQADLLVILSDTDGLSFGGPSGRRIQVVENMGDSVFTHVQDKKTHFTVGGMRSKLEAIQMSVSSGIPVFLADGRQKNVLSRLVSGEDLGTFFMPAKKKGQARKDWIYHFLNHMQRGNRR